MGKDHHPKLCKCATRNICAAIHKAGDVWLKVYKLQMGLTEIDFLCLILLKAHAFKYNT